MLIKHWQLCYKLENHGDNFLTYGYILINICPVVSPYPECHMVIIWSKFWLIIQRIIKNQHCYFFNLTSMLLMIFYVKTCLEFLQELSYFNFFITGKKLTYLKKLYGPFLWMGFNCLNPTATSRRQFTFYHSVPRNSWYSFHQPWSHPLILNMGPLDWESGALATRPLLH